MAKRKKGARKGGRLTQGERDYIIRNMSALDVNEIADNLNRTPDIVRRFLGENQADIVQQKQQYEAELFKAETKTHNEGLHGSVEWGRIRQEFSSEELISFERRYGEIMRQFSGDVLSTESTQIIQMIRFETLMSRNLRQQRQAKEQLDLLDSKRKKIYNDLYQHEGNKTGETLKDLKGRLDIVTGEIEGVKTEYQTLSKEYLAAQDRHAKLLESLKATRSQRVKEIENRNTNFLGLLRDIQQKKTRQEIGEELGYLELGVKKRRAELVEPHNYQNGMVDQPLILPEG